MKTKTYTSVKFGGGKIYPNSDFVSNAPKRARKQWHDKLVRGGYKQGTRCMYDPSENEYCCLGVGSLLVVSPNAIRNKDMPNATSKFAKLMNQAAGTCLSMPAKYRQYDPEIGVSAKGYITYTAVELNDGGMSFADIAKLIYPELYVVVEGCRK